MRCLRFRIRTLMVLLLIIGLFFAGSISLWRVSQFRHQKWSLHESEAQRKRSK